MKIGSIKIKDLLLSLEKEIKRRNIDTDNIADIISSNKALTSRRIIGGYSSVSIVDREGQKIPIPALKDAAANFMKNVYARPAMVFHSDVQIGRVLPYWTDPDSGKTMTSHVDGTGWYTLVEVRDDIEIADKVWAEVLKGNIRSFSIAGSSKEKLRKQENGINFEQVNSLEIYETTLCEIPVCQEAKFQVLWQGNDRVSY